MTFRRGTYYGGGWRKGLRRNDCPGAAELLRRIGSRREVARAAGVSPRAVQAWATGRKTPSLVTVMAVIDYFFPLHDVLYRTLSGVVFCDGEASGTGTIGTPCGCGEYTLRAARGLPCHDYE